MEAMNAAGWKVFLPVEMSCPKRTNEASADRPMWSRGEKREHRTEAVTWTKIRHGRVWPGREFKQSLECK